MSTSLRRAAREDGRNDQRGNLRGVLTDPDMSDSVVYRKDLSGDYNNDGQDEFYLSEAYDGYAIVTGPDHTARGVTFETLEYVMYAIYDQPNGPPIEENDRVLIDITPDKTDAYKTVKQRPDIFDGETYVEYRLTPDGRGEAKTNPPLLGGTTVADFEGGSLDAAWQRETIYPGTRGTSTIAGFEGDTLDPAWATASFAPGDRGTYPGKTIASFEGPILDRRMTFDGFNRSDFSLSDTQVQVGDQSLEFSDIGQNRVELTLEEFARPDIVLSPDSNTEIHFDMYVRRGTDFRSGHRIYIVFGRQNFDNLYMGRVLPGDENTNQAIRVAFFEKTNGSASALAVGTALESDVSGGFPTWRRLHIEWREGGDSTVSLHALDGTKILETSALLDNPNLSVGHVGFGTIHDNQTWTSYIDRFWYEEVSV